QRAAPVRESRPVGADGPEAPIRWISHRRATNLMLVVSGSTIGSTCGWLVTRTTCDLARPSICRMPRGTGAPDTTRIDLVARCGGRDNSLKPHVSSLKPSRGLYSSARIFWKECALSGNEVSQKSQKGVVFVRLLFSKWLFAWNNQ